MNIEITVDNRTELLGILLLISDYNKTHAKLIEECSNKEYREKIFSKFNRFKNEKAVILLNKIFKTLNFSYDAPVSLFLQLNEDFTFDKLDMYPYENRLNKSQLVLDFLREIPDFAKKIDFESYYNSNKDFYNKIIEETIETIDMDRVLSFISSFYKMDISNIKFVVNLLPYTTNGNFGTNHNNVTYSNLGLKKCQKDELTFIRDQDFGTLILHEFSHSVINPLTDKYSTIKGKAFADIWDIMCNKAYGSVEAIINEHIIRSIEIFYLKNIVKTKESVEFANQRLQREKEGGFKYIQACLDSIENYFKDIDSYENFEQYFPNLLKDLENETKKELII